MRRAALFFFWLLCAQAADKPAKFEVAAIKPSAPGGQGCGTTSHSPLQLTMHDCTVRDLVKIAWDLPTFELFVPVDQPWTSSLRFDIAAKSAKAFSNRRMILKRDSPGDF